ncbi:MAG: hypothetical protein AMXMBFR33_21950 [Candidatus Xenobia bacterium]
MKVLVDTSVWSLAFRRKKVEAGAVVMELRELIQESRSCLVGPIRQELLSGIFIPDQSEKLRLKLRAFPDESLTTRDFELAASCFIECRAAGIQGSNTDFVLCAFSLERDIPVFTTDNDFELYSAKLGVKLHRPRN